MRFSWKALRWRQQESPTCSFEEMHGTTSLQECMAGIAGPDRSFPWSTRECHLLRAEKCFRWSCKQPDNHKCFPRSTGSSSNAARSCHCGTSHCSIQYHHSVFIDWLGRPRHSNPSVSRSNSACGRIRRPPQMLHHAQHPGIGSLSPLALIGCSVLCESHVRLTVMRVSDSGQQPRRDVKRKMPSSPSEGRTAVVVVTD